MTKPIRQPQALQVNAHQPRIGDVLRQLDPIAKGVGLGLLIVTVTGLGWIAVELWGKSRTHKLVLAAGNATGESYLLAKSIESVVEANVHRVTIDVVETDGTSDNLKRLENREADLATAQADVPAGKEARTIAILYSDSFQLVVQGNSTVQRIGDLKGKRIGLVTTGGQYKSFLEIVNHFGLVEQDFTFVGDSDQAIDLAFQQKQVDAIFRVRAISNTQISDLIQVHGGRLIQIDQAEAMQVKNPAFEPTKIPKGAYQGKEPTVPAAELSTISVQRLLVADSRINPELINQITQVINENRRELKAAVPNQIRNAAPLISNIRRPELTGGTGIPIHPGALSYYDRNNPSFIQENADYVGLILTVGLLIGSWLLEFKRWIECGKKDLADTYIAQVIDVMTACQNSTIVPQDALVKIDSIFQQVAIELLQEGISQESFRTFNEAYKTVREVIDRKAV